MRDGLNPPRVSAVPSADDVARARDLFESLFGDFLLGGMIRSDGQTAEYANAIGLALLPFCRDMIDGPIPAHLINKPSAGEGAGLLIDVIATIWTGQVATAMDYPPRKEEIGKTILAKLRSGAPYLLFDNIPVTIDSSALAIAITQGWMDGRILGRTDAGAVDPIEVRSPMIFTGIDVKTSEEIRRRMVLIGLESGEVSPEKRTGPKPGTAWRHTNLKKWARENRSDLVWACLTLVQNWIARGRQPYDAPQAKGSFEEWQRVIGGILRDAGIEYFGANEDALNKATSDALTDGVAVLTSAIAAYPVGTYFSIGSQEDGSGIMDLLNKGLDGNPISIPKWGYKEEDGTYGSAVSIGKHFSSFALKPHLTKRLSAGRLIDVEIKLDQCEDPRNKTKRYRLKMRVPGGEWIESEDDPAWAKIS